MATEQQGQAMPGRHVWYATAVLAVVLGAAYCLTHPPFVNITEHSNSADAKNDILSLLIVADSFRDPLSEDALQDRFDAIFDREVSAEEAFGSTNLYVPRIDPWGNPYLTTLHADKNGIPRLHFYSLGADGQSQTAGDDEDDIRSWKRTSGQQGEAMEWRISSGRSEEQTNESGVEMSDGAWKFSQPPNCAVITLRRIVSGDSTILMAFHDEDDESWQFLDGQEATTDDAVVVGLGEIVQLDRSVAELADLPAGWVASRDAQHAPWVRSRQETE